MRMTSNPAVAGHAQPAMSTRTECGPSSSTMSGWSVTDPSGSTLTTMDDEPAGTATEPLARR